MKKLLLAGLMLCLYSFATAQTTVSGVVTAEGEALIGATVLEKGTNNGVVTDIDGNYSITVANGATIVVTYIGYGEQEIMVGDESTIDVTMTVGSLLDEVVVTGSRSRPRTILDSPVPIDNISAAQLQSSGKQNIEQMLNYKVPSFNSQNQAISDATAHYDPADLRGLGPSRTLVLVNGKRKNQSAQVYLNRTPGKGEVGVDLKSIPVAAIDRIEVLRDGASAQYGSDAIAGVINMILKKDAEYTSINVKSGVTSQGDGYNFAADVNTSMNVGDGNLNLTVGYSNQKQTNRPGTIGAGDQGSAPTTADTTKTGALVYPGGAADAAYIADLAFWGRNETWIANNPTAGMIVGQPDIEKLDVFANFEHDLGENAKFYTFHGLTTRTGKSFAFYRSPYWRKDVAYAEFRTPVENFVGYHPTFETNILDNMSSAGFEFKVAGFDADASITYGRNSVDYTVTRSVNRDYLADHGWSPRTFKPGGYAFSNTIGNLDLSRSLDAEDKVFLGLGLETKKENFIANEGDYFSYYKGGSDSFAGIKPEEALDESRTSTGVYATLDYDVSDDFLIGAAARFEDYSDFGTNFSYKVNARYKFNKDGALRGSFSTGFRAPTLHQRYLINSQYITIQSTGLLGVQGTLANDNPAIVALGVPKLFAETSENLTAGATYRFSDYFNASVDFYSINVNDRVLFSSQVEAKTEGDAIDQILTDNNVAAAQFFINAGDTKVTGVDIVLNMSDIRMGAGTLGGILSANFNEATIEAINTPKVLADLGYDIFDRREQSLITKSRPKSKIILGLFYSTNKFTLGMDNTRFGEVTVTAASGPENDQVHSAKLVTDLYFTYKLHSNISFNFNANNVFDVYPDELLASTGESSGGRFKYSSIVQQQNFLGTNFSVGLNMKISK